MAAPASAAPTVGGGDQIEQIVVTAERRSEDLISVANSVTAITGSQLADNGIRTVADLQMTTPGLVPSNGFGYTQIYIRGVGNNIYVGADPSVATYIDGVPRIYGSMENNFVNVKRVEVLKGAQGGLYGRNATGGVINIITRQPNFDNYEATGKVSYGTKDTFEISGYLNIPISENLAWNISATRQTHGYYVKNLATPNPYTAANFPTGSAIGTPQQTADYFNSAVKIPKGMQNQNFWAVDSKLAGRFGHLSVTVDADYNAKKDSNGAGVIEVDPALEQSLANYLFPLYGFNVNLQPGFFPTTSKKFAGYYGLGEPQIDLIDFGGSIKAVYSLPFADVTSISAYRENNSFYYADGSYNSPPIIPERVKNDKHYYYQELRLTSTGDGPFQYMAGATYLSATLNSYSSISYLPPLPAPPPTRVKDKIKDWSVYAQASYDITSALNLTASLRYIHETNKAQFTSPVVSGTSSTEHKLIPAATLKYTFPDHSVAYVRFAEGFKAGGVNLVDPPSVFPAGSNYGKIFGPEQVKTYEAGYRARLFNDSVQFTSSIFYNDYSDLQTVTTGNVTHSNIVLAIVNAKSARTYGAEANIEWRAKPWLTLGANAGYLEATYTNFENTDGTVLNTFNHNGERMIFSPKWQMSFRASVDKPLNDKYRLIGNIMTSYNGSESLYLASPPYPPVGQGGYWLTNLKVGIATIEDKYELSLYVRNVFDQSYYQVGNTSAIGATYGWGDPRIIGAEFTVNM